MAESVWDTYKREGEDDGGGYFLRNTDFPEGQGKVLTFKEIEWREQGEKTPEVFKTPDGRELLLTFEEDVKGTKVKRGYTAKSHKNALIIALKQAGIEPGMTFEAVRTGNGTDMRFKANVVRDDGTVVVVTEEEGGKKIPF